MRKIMLTVPDGYGSSALLVDVATGEEVLMVAEMTFSRLEPGHLWTATLLFVERRDGRRWTTTEEVWIVTPPPAKPS